MRTLTDKITATLATAALLYWELCRSAARIVVPDRSAR